MKNKTTEQEQQEIVRILSEIIKTIPKEQLEAISNAYTSEKTSREGAKK